nr:hypothetical protein pA62H2_p22 [Pseudomonas sp.]
MASWLLRESGAQHPGSAQRFEWGLWSAYDIELNQGRKTVDGFSKVHRLRMEVDFINFGIGSHHECRLQRDREHSVS